LDQNDPNKISRKKMTFTVFQHQKKQNCRQYAGALRQCLKDKKCIGSAIVFSYGTKNKEEFSFVLKPSLLTER
jgi:hypothetical protein